MIAQDRRWRYLTVRTGWLFGKDKPRTRLNLALMRLSTEWSHHCDRDTQRWTYYFRAYLTEQEHAELARTFKAKERKR